MYQRTKASIKANVLCFGAGKQQRCQVTGRDLRAWEMNDDSDLDRCQNAHLHSAHDWRLAEELPCSLGVTLIYSVSNAIRADTSNTDTDLALAAPLLWLWPKNILRREEHYVTAQHGSPNRRRVWKHCWLTLSFATLPFNWPGYYP